jgi:hypothetical protein
MLIKADVIDKIRDNVTNLLQTYTKELNAAMDDNDGVDISLPIKIRQGGSKLDVAVGINFIKTRVKDSVIFAVSDQKELFAVSDQKELLP